MNSRRTLTLVAAAAAFGLQACDVTVREAPTQDSAAVSTPAPAPAAPETPAATDASTATTTAITPATTPQDPAIAPATPTAAAPAGALPDANATLPADTSAAVTNATAPLPPGTNAMGAAGMQPGAAMGATGMQPGAAPMIADTTAAGIAAPTELARFLQEHPPGVKKPESAASKEAGGKPDAAKKADGKGVKGAKS